jgi:mannose-6-phosphate isomerase
VDEALACMDFARGAVRPSAPTIDATQPALRETLLRCAHFDVCRLSGTAPFTVGAVGSPRVLVCIEGSGHVAHDGTDVEMEKGAVVLLPASLGVCRFRPDGDVALLELGVPALS